MTATFIFALPTLANASPVSDVTDVQKALNDFGYTVNATGTFDEDTKNAVKEFQEAHNLEVTGELDNLSYQVIMGKDFSSNMSELSTLTSAISNNVNVTPVMNIEGQEVKQPSYMKGNSIPANYAIRANIINYAMQFEGVPYVYGGSSPNGFDCSGFVQYVFGNNGIDLPRTADYQAEVGIPVSKEDLQPGDLVFFAGDYVNVSHVGIYVGNGQMIHASSGKHQIDYDDLSRPYRVEHFHSARRIIN